MFKWNENKTVSIDPPKRTKKMTATRFACALNLSPWKSPFETWCEITKTYEEPFEDTQYTIAGKAIEPKQIDYCRKTYFLTTKTPTDVYGPDYFKKTFGDFFPDVDIFGGMWDCLVVDKDGKPTKVIECKTTKRVEDWNGKIPEYYALQAALYAYLLGVDDVIMVASFLEEGDYVHPEDFKPSVKNTILKPFKVSERYPNFADYIATATKWWNDHVVTGISPTYDEKRDAEALKELRTTHIDTDVMDVSKLIERIECLTVDLESKKAELKPMETELKQLTDELKNRLMGQFKDGDKKVDVKGGKYLFTVSKKTSAKIDEEALTADGLISKYMKYTESFALTKKEIKNKE